MQKKLGGERGYLALKDLRIKSKFPWSNMPIREVGQSGERKNLRGRRKKRKKDRAGRLRSGLKHKLGVSHPGAKLGAKLPAMSPSTSASSPGARRQGRRRRDVLARRQHQWRRAKGPDSKIFPPGIYL